MSHEMSKLEGMFQDLEEIINTTEDKEVFKEALENLNYTLSNAYYTFEREIKEIEEAVEYETRNNRILRRTG